MKRIAIIGAGASGLTAACYASGDGRHVLLFEKQKKIGRKLLVTGNGRCNISNRNIIAGHYHGHNSRFVDAVFSRFSLQDTITFFEELGVPFIEEDEGRLYPASLQASTITKVFQYELKKRNVDLQLHRRIERIEYEETGFTLYTAGAEEHRVDSVILAAGSCAFPPAGASNIGYDLARSLGHRVYEPWPVILPVTIPLKSLHQLQGIKWDAAIRVEVNGKEQERSVGELLFTAYGISGPVSLNVSRSVNAAVIAGKSPVVIIDLYPSMSGDDLARRLDRLWSDGGKKTGFSLLGIMKERMPEVLCGIAGVDPEKRVASLTPADKEKIAGTMKNLILEPGKPRGFQEAVAAAGGVDVDEIDPATMESKLVRNLYITGELLDVDGDSGGYNLQFAWSTGAIAGMAQ
ncbi:MAG: aminoacetone oxidase family FAD-binding enzyme [Spirochaetae bacterium HGW-Spirochaetae-1]|jgi:hypothetical protein|nr:MAG: aminoacetone oxidase family FAD-binding enzyme [Spirochaetae bacterium HGW-Spirochaetae-1]